MTYYGRWTYKYEMARRSGAAGVLIVHETGPAGYRLQRRAGQDRRAVRSRDARQEHGPRGDRRLDVARRRRRSCSQMAGQDFDELKEQAATREFKPVPLGADRVDDDQEHAAHDRLAQRRREARRQRSAAEGRVRRLHRALGSFRRRRPGQRRHDLQRRARQCARASRRCSRSRGRSRSCQPPPKRSILFLVVTAEEQGLLGSQYYSVTPALSAGEDARQHQHGRLSTWGRTKDITVVGLGASDLDDYAARRGRRAGARRARPTPSRRRASTTAPITSTSPSRACRRSTRTPASSTSASRRSTASRSATSTPNSDYHTPSDEVKPDWDLSGAREDAAAAARGRLPRGAGRQVSGVEAGQRVQGEARRDAEEVGTEGLRD